MKKNILFLTGTRADFGKMKPLMRKLEESDDFECRVFVTGMHMLPRYGSTIDEVQKSGFKNIFVYTNQSANYNTATPTVTPMDMILASTIEGLGHYVRELRPDLIVVHGDRIEALAGAIVGMLNNILVAHIEGGELSGSVDELIRHAVSKLARLHFVANEDASRRLIQMGESPESIFVIGSPDVDLMLSSSLPSLEEAKKRYEINFEEYAFFSYHPVVTEPDKLKQNADVVISALLESKMNFVVIYPNNDAGSYIILDAITTLENNQRFRIFPSLRFEHFLTLLKHARAIVGNSSAGIRTAPAYGVPTVNIGKRQMNRFDYTSIINVDEGKEAILNALNSLPKKVEPSFHFGKGNSAELFIEHLRNSKLWQVSPQKQFLDKEVTG